MMVGIIAFPVMSAFADSFGYDWGRWMCYILDSSAKTVSIEANSEATRLGAVVIPTTVYDERNGGRVAYRVTSVCGSAFSGCSGLTSVTIPDSVTQIGSYAFRNCTGLKSVVIGGGVIDICDSAFYNCTKLTSVDLPDSVKAIEDNAFAGCSSLVNMRIPNGVTIIGNSLFSDCYSLTSVTIGDGVTSIGNYIFSGCSALVNMIIPNSVKGIGDYAFSDCNALKSVTIGDNVTSIGKYTFSGCVSLENVNIPDSVKSIGVSAFSGCSGIKSVAIGKSLTSLGNNAFSGCVSLKNVTISEGVKSIWYYAFRNCSGLENVIIPQSVTSIGGSAFSGCTSLTNVTIPSSVTSIGDFTFSGCTSLTNVTIPSSVTSIGDSAFSGCNNLTNVTIPDDVTSIGAYAFDGCDESLYDTTTIIGAKLLNGWVVGNTNPSGHLSLLGVRGLGARAFYGCNGITSVTIGLGVRYIGHDSFFGCSSLTSVTIPDSIVSIGSNAFSDCNELDRVYIFDLAKWCDILFDNEAANPLYNAQNIYLNGEKMTTLIIPDSVTNIRNRVFCGCSSLENIVIGNGITRIGHNAFSGCNGLKSVAIGNGVTSIGDNVFSDCNELTNVVIASGFKSIGAYMFSGCSSLTSVTLPDSVTSIGGAAFRNCSGLKSVTIGNGVTSISASIFAGCSSLMSLTLPFVGSKRGNTGTSDSLFGYIFGTSSYNDGVSTKQYYSSSSSSTYYIPASLRSVVITEETSLGFGAFDGCSGVTTLSIPDSVRSIGTYAFRNCSGLRNVIIPQCVCSSKMSSVFPAAYQSITNIIVHDSVQNIASAAFSECTSLTSATIPNSVTSIGGSAFSGCSSLISLTLPFIGARRGNTGTSDSLFGYIFGSSSYNGGVRTSQDYSASSYSTYYIPATLTTVVITDETVLGYGAFCDCGNLKNVVIPDGVTSIGDYMFYGCSKLLSVTIPYSIKSIGASAFRICYGLTSVALPNGMTSIGDHVFAGCSGLKSMTIPDSITRISDYAFLNCTGLTSVMIPDDVTDLGNCAFYGCSGLRSVTLPQSVCYGTMSTIFPAAYQSITNIIISDSVTNIGNSAFYECASLTNVKLPEGLMRIGDYAFARCESLVSLAIPYSVISIGRKAFDCCSEMICNTTTISGAKVVDGWVVDNTNDISDSLNLIDVRGISDYAFEGCSGLKRVVISNCGTHIGEKAFLDCTGLESVAAPMVLYDKLHSASIGCANGLQIRWTDAVSGGDAEWLLNEEMVHSGRVGWKSGMISNNHKSWFEVHVASGGRLSFSWKASTESDGEDIYDYAYLSVDGVPQGSISDGYRLEGVAVGGKTDWVNVIIDIQGGGSHTIRWTYCKDEVDEANVGDDCVWLDEVLWTPKVSVSYDINGAVGQVPCVVSELAGTTLTLPKTNGFSRVNHTFGGWSDGMHVYAADTKYTLGYSNVVIAALWSANTFAAPMISSVDVANGGTIEKESATITITSEEGAEIHYTTDGSMPTAQSPLYTRPFVADGMSVTIKAIATRDNYFDSAITSFTFTRKPYSLAECIGLEGFDVTTGGTTGWSRVLGGEAQDNIAALKSGVIGDGQTNWVQIAISGAGQLSFWWKVSCEGANRGKRRDGCTFMVDGLEVEFADGTTNDWIQITVEVCGTNEHVLKWAYGKNENGTYEGEDCAWLDSVVWTPAVTDPIPEIVSDTDVETALTGSADVNLTANITNATQYTDYRAWALSVTNGTTTAQMIKESTRTWLSYALGADALIGKEITSNDVRIVAFEAANGDGGAMGSSRPTFAFEVAIDGINIGGGSVAVETLKENLKKVLGVEGAATLSSGVFSSDNIDITFDAPVDGKARFTVTPPVDAGNSFFMRVKVK